MIELPPFRLHRPATAEEAVRILAEHRGDARAIAGGTDLIVNLRQEVATPTHVVSLASVGGLDGIEPAGDGGVRIGALVTLERLERSERLLAEYPVLAEAASLVSGPTLRAMGTLGGNLCLDTRCHWYNQERSWRHACGYCLKKDGSVCHVAPGSSLCWAAYSGDLAPALLVLRANLTILGPRGERQTPIARFFLEDGLKKFDLGQDEIITAVHLPASRRDLRGSYRKLRIRHALDFPLAGVALATKVDPDGTFREAEVALTAVGPRPFLVEGATELLEGAPVGEEDIFERVAHLARRVANPMHTSAGLPPAYRRLRVGLMVREALRAVSGGEARQRGA